jgi:hypothetical protein
VSSVETKKATNNMLVARLVSELNEQQWNYNRGYQSDNGENNHRPASLMALVGFMLEWRLLEAILPEKPLKQPLNSSGRQVVNGIDQSPQPAENSHHQLLLVRKRKKPPAECWWLLICVLKQINHQTQRLSKYSRCRRAARTSESSESLSSAAK